MAIIAPAPKTADPYYASPEWKALRAACLQRDGFTCVVPGCGKPAVVADHIVGRRTGGADELSQLRSLCRGHDNEMKENHLGVRRGSPRAPRQG